MIKRMQGVSAHITYLKKKEEDGHRSRCIYFKPKNSCEIYGECRTSVDCTKYKEEKNTEKKKKKKGKQKAKENRKTGIKEGDTIKIFDAVNEVLMTITLVDKGQSDILNDKISIESPLGKAVLGKEKGDIVEVYTDKKREYRITNDKVK